MVSSDFKMVHQELRRHGESVAAWKSPTNPGGWILVCDPIPWFANCPYVKEADEPGLSGKPLNAKIWQVLWPIKAILSMVLFFVRLKITDQSSGLNFRMWSHPLIRQPSIICKRSGRTRAFRESTKRQNRASIAAYMPVVTALPFCFPLFFYR